MRVEFIAKCCYELSNTYIEGLGLKAPPPWNETTFDQREEMIKIVHMIICNPEYTLYELHEIVCAWKTVEDSSDENKTATQMHIEDADRRLPNVVDVVECNKMALIKRTVELLM